MSRFKVFLNLTRNARRNLCSVNKNNVFNSINSPKCTHRLYCSSKTLTQETEKDISDLPEIVENKQNASVVPKLKSLEPGSGRNVDLSEYGSVPLPSFNFAAYADQSPILQEFIKLGVELYKLEKQPSIGEFLLTLDFETNVKPYLIFLRDNGVSPDDFGKIITKHPLLFKENLDDLEVRINYLKSKKFTQEMISHIITKFPKWLSIPVKPLDGRLGTLQNLLNLSGDEVRSIISRVPSIIAKEKKFLFSQVFVLKEDLELDEKTVKNICLVCPALLKKDGLDIVKTFDFLTKEMKVSKYLIEKQPKILNSRKFILQARHKFLVLLGRAQYNPKLPGYVSLTMLYESNDELFAEKVAKSNVKTYNIFLKTL